MYDNSLLGATVSQSICNAFAQTIVGDVFSGIRAKYSPNASRAFRFI